MAPGRSIERIDAETPDDGIVELSVVAPAHNEAEYLERAVRVILEGLRARHLSFEVLICENGSSDDTAAIAARLAGHEPEVRALQLSAADYGAALRAGFHAAQGDLVANVDVDLVDLDFVDRAVAVMAADPATAIVIGTKRGAGAQDRRAVSRRIVTHGFSAVMRYGFGLQASDTHGLKLLRRAPLAPLVAACAFTSDIFDTELILRAERAGLRVAEVPVAIDEIRPARTPITSRIPRTLSGLGRLRVHLWRSEVPWLPAPAAPTTGVEARVLQAPPALPVASQPMSTQESRAEGPLSAALAALAFRVDNLTASIGEYRKAQERILVDVDEAMRDTEVAVARIERAQAQLAARVEIAVSATGDLERRISDTIGRQAQVHADHLAAVASAHDDALAKLTSAFDRSGSALAWPPEGPSPGATEIEELLAAHADVVAGRTAEAISSAAAEAREETLRREVERAGDLDRLGEAMTALLERAEGADLAGMDGEPDALTRIEANLEALTAAIHGLRRRIPLRARPEPVLDDAAMSSLAEAVAARLAPPAGPPPRPSKDRTPRR